MKVDVPMDHGLASMPQDIPVSDMDEYRTCLQVGESKRRAAVAKAGCRRPPGCPTASRGARVDASGEIVGSVSVNVGLNTRG